MKSIFDPLSTKVLLIGCALLAVFTSTVGFSSDFNGYLSNLMAEFTGFFISIIITVLIIDIYSQHNREKQWDRVKKITYQSLSERFMEIVIQLCAHYKKNSYIKEFIDQKGIANKSIIALFDRLIDEFKTTFHNDNRDFNSFVNFYDNSKQEVDSIRKVLLPRIIQSSDKQDIIDALVEFDSFIMDLEYTILTHKYVKEAEFSSNTIEELLEKIRYVYLIICQNNGLADRPVEFQK